MAILSSTILDTQYGEFKVSYHEANGKMCVSLSQGDITKGIPLLRIHSSCLFSETFHSIDCDCNLQFTKAMEMIQKEQCGAIIYLYQEGRGVGLANKIKAMDIERTEHVDTVEAFNHLGFQLDDRDYTVAMQALKDLNISKDIKLMCNNYRKMNALEKSGYIIKEQVILKYSTNEHVKKYLKTKKEKLGHKIDNSLISGERSEGNCQNITI